MRFLITGGAGFIGSCVARRLIQATSNEVMVLDKLTYSGNMNSLSSVFRDPRFQFMQTDIADNLAVRTAINKFQPDVIMNLAAETHVDRSIDDPCAFIRTNVLGTFCLLEAALEYWRNLSRERRLRFRFHHISTDEVFGTLGAEGHFNEASSYSPNSPYAASKASSDHFVTAWNKTYGLPTLLTNCSNNYGPYHFPEKLIPLTIINAIEGNLLSVYGNGAQVRDWLHVEDHVDALLTVALKAKPGSSYAIGGNEEHCNIDVVKIIAGLVDEMAPDAAIGMRQNLIHFVPDRPGHDLRYAIDASRIKSELGWLPRHNFDRGLRDTVAWYIANRDWWQSVRSDVYRGERLGLRSTTTPPFMV
jgi:dTDP-glucose 4,6-dehydratase